uniref:Uncharacterized protein n=1 Tax=Picea glauca TaxID=3330 RepID=A0A101M3K9_PICGL|nr:hypothetical protein ABT39_MTgene117 [Picea glauca]
MRQRIWHLITYNIFSPALPSKTLLPAPFRMAALKLFWCSLALSAQLWSDV